MVSALEIFLVMCYTNLLFTYLLTYLPLKEIRLSKQTIKMNRINDVSTIKQTPQNRNSSIVVHNHGCICTVVILIIYSWYGNF